MPLNPKGEEIMSSMKGQYGPEKGEQVFYASKNAGKISGVDGDDCGCGGDDKGIGFSLPAPAPPPGTGGWGDGGIDAGAGRPATVYGSDAMGPDPSDMVMTGTAVMNRGSSGEGRSDDDGKSGGSSGGSKGDEGPVFGQPQGPVGQMAMPTMMQPPMGMPMAPMTAQPMPQPGAAPMTPPVPQGGGMGGSPPSPALDAAGELKGAEEQLAAMERQMRQMQQDRDLSNQVDDMRKKVLSMRGSLRDSTARALGRKPEDEFQHDPGEAPLRELERAHDDEQALGRVSDACDALMKRLDACDDLMSFTPGDDPMAVTGGGDMSAMDHPRIPTPVKQWAGMPPDDASIHGAGSGGSGAAVMAR